MNEPLDSTNPVTSPKYHRVAVYPSVLYGEDFIWESITSIARFVDHVFVVMMQRPWGETDGVEYEGAFVRWPERFDNTRERIACTPAAMHNYVTLIEAQKATPWNRWGYAVNEIVRQQCTTQEVLLLDPDCVFREDEAERVFEAWQRHREYQWAHVPQIELWRTPAWRIERPRAMASLHRGDLELLSTKEPARRPKSVELPGHIHNLGFCVSEQTMRWKHLTALAFSPVVGESLPNPRWFEVKWRNWQPGVRDLEPSQGCERAIAEAFPYDVQQLPAAIRTRYDAGEWPRYATERP